MMATPLTLQEMEGYDDIKFLEQPPDSLACPICLAVLHEPHLLSCCGTHICQVPYVHVSLYVHVNAWHEVPISKHYATI